MSAEFGSKAGADVESTAPYPLEKSPTFRFSKLSVRGTHTEFRLPQAGVVP
jgi:hypothetical protein